MNLRDVALDVWRSFLNQPYKWGGDDPLDGVDCSGLVLEGLKSVGILPRELDLTADDLLQQKFKHYPKEEVEGRLRPGMLVFWGKPVAKHIEIVWASFPDRVLTMGASGGGPRITDRAEASKANAYVKIRRITPGWHSGVDPFPTPF